MHNKQSQNVLFLTQSVSESVRLTLMMLLLKLTVPMTHFSFVNYKMCTIVDDKIFMNRHNLYWKGPESVRQIGVNMTPYAHAYAYRV